MSKYDGWVLKRTVTRKPYLIVHFFHELRRDVIKHIDKAVGVGYEEWKKEHGKNYKIVKVKIIEVND